MPLWRQKGIPMRITNEEYKKLYQKASPRSPMLKDIVLAFLIGGAICTVGQAIKEYFISLGLDEKAVSSALSITMIFLGVLLTDLRIYPKIAKYAGAGTIVPITGFANSIASPAVELQDRRSGAGHLRENVHHRRAGAGVRPRHVQRGLRADPAILCR